MLNILYFASLREELACEREVIALPAAATVQGLVCILRARGGVWETALASNRRWRVAVNHELARAETTLKSGDEVAFFPPVTGG